MDIFNAGLVRLSCIQAAEQVLEQETQLVTRTRQTTCEYEFGTPAFEEDPCCNDNLEVCLRPIFGAIALTLRIHSNSSPPFRPLLVVFPLILKLKHQFIPLETQSLPKLVAHQIVP